MQKSYESTQFWLFNAFNWLESLIKLIIVILPPDHLVLGVLVDVHHRTVVHRLGRVRVLQRREGFLKVRVAGVVRVVNINFLSNLIC